MGVFGALRLRRRWDRAKKGFVAEPRLKHLSLRTLEGMALGLRTGGKGQSSDEACQAFAGIRA